MNISNETLERVEYAECVSYVYFVECNNDFLKEIHRCKDQFNPWDASGVTKNNQKFIVEFKVRNANASQYSGKTMIETQKLKSLREFQKQHPDFTVKYICYFNDCGLSFNLSSRYRQGGNSDILSVYDMPCKMSYYNTAMQFDTVKKVNFLSFNTEMWGDKMVCYSNFI